MGSCRQPIPSAIAVGAFVALVLLASALIVIVRVVASVDPIEDEIDPDD